MAGRAGKRRRVLRGGSFNNNEDNARASYRNNNTPDNEWNNNGFRCGWGVAFHVSPCSTVVRAMRSVAQASNAVCSRTRRRGRTVERDSAGHVLAAVAFRARGSGE